MISFGHWAHSPVSGSKYGYKLFRIKCGLWSLSKRMIQLVVYGNPSVWFVLLWHLKIVMTKNMVKSYRSLSIQLWSRSRTKSYLKIKKKKKRKPTTGLILSGIVAQKLERNILLYKSHKTFRCPNVQIRQTHETYVACNPEANMSELRTLKFMLNELSTKINFWFWYEECFACEDTLTCRICSS